jgi:MFS family permease
MHSSFCTTEGIPLGFAATAVATQLRRQDIGPAEIGAFVASFYLPWAFKWAFGPIIDVFASERLGRRRGWILGTQILMALTLLSTVLLRLPEQLWLFTIILLVHNTFGAMQDVAIDALACGTLHEDERGTANGMMFAGAAIGQLIGGSGVLFLMGYTGFQPTFFVVSGCILLVTACIVLPMQEAPGPARPTLAGSRLRSAGREMRDFAVSSFRSFLGTRGAFSGLVALCRTGDVLGLALQSNLAVELGMSNDQVAALNTWSAADAAVGMVAGGYFRTARAAPDAALYRVHRPAGTVSHGHADAARLDHAGEPQRAEPPRGARRARHRAVDRDAGLQLLQRTHVRHALGDLHGRDQPGRGGDAVHRLHGADEPDDFVQRGLAGHRDRGRGYPRTMLVTIFGVLCLTLIPFRPETGESFTDAPRRCVPARWPDSGADVSRLAIGPGMT